MRNEAIELLEGLAGLSAADAYDRLGDVGDGLPVAAPERGLLDEMATASGRDAGDVIVQVPPLRGELTVERLALCAALAGCEARHLPVLVAACDLLVEPELNAYGFLTTTGSAAPLLLVNGPAAPSLGFSGGAGCLGPGGRANATVGRALSLVVRVLGGARAGVADMATLGQPAKLTCCFAEHEAASPWPPFHVDRGFDADATTVTVTGIAGIVETFDAEATEPEVMLRSIAEVLAGSAPVLDHGRTVGGGQPLVVVTPEWAGWFAKRGLSKADVQAILHQQAVRTTADGDRLHVADGADDVLVVVAGGVGIKQAVLPNWNGGARAVTRLVDAPR